MTSVDIKKIIRQELPQIIAEDLSIRDFILRTVSDYYAPKQETESRFDDFAARFDRILAELERDREEQARKWDEQNRKWDEQNRKWDENTKRLDKMQEQIDQSLVELQRDREEQNRKWEENNQRRDKMQEQIDRTLDRLEKSEKKYDSTIGALGSRWGLYSEASFRNALAAILEESFEVEVLNINDYDSDGIVFGRPDQVEIDVIIKNGFVIACEIKSSIDKAGIYIFDRKVEFYQQHYHRQVNRKILISPMVDKRAFPVAENLDIEVYSYAEDVPVD